MSLVLARVDCRLIHGQVLEAWVPHTRSDFMIVANDELSEDTLQSAILAMAVPPTMEMSIMSVPAAAKALAEGRWKDKRIILLVATLKDALTCLEAGVKMESLNLGNLVCSPGKRQITGSVHLDEDDMKYMEEIIAHGVRILAQPVPTEQSRDMADVIGYGR